MKQQGHYCKVCGEYKANEKFSGKGHAAHICKKCAALSPEERSKEILFTRLDNLPWQLSREQIAWLKRLAKDKRSEISEAAKEHLAQRFPFAERNKRKKQLHISTMRLCVCDALSDEYGDELFVDAAFEIRRKGSTLVRYDMSGETSITLEPKDMAKLLNRLIHEYEVCYWGEDDGMSSDEAEANHEDDGDDLMLFSDEQEDEPARDDPQTWAVHLEYTNGAIQDFASCNPVPDQLNMLVLELLDFFEENPFEAYDE